MPYSTPDQVKLELKGLTYSNTSTVKEADVEQWIAEADEEINSAVGVKYKVPVVAADSPFATILLRTISIALVKGRVADQLKIFTGGERNQDAQMFHTMTPKEAREKLKMIQMGKLILRDAELVDSRDGVADYTTDDAEIPGQDDRTFTYGVDEW